MAGHWTRQDDITGARTKKAIAYGDMLAAIINGTSKEGWEGLTRLVDPDRFGRRGNERDEEMDWPTYRAMLENWRGSGDTYEKHLFRATEAGNVVYLDFDERSVTSEGEVSTLRSISIYEFDEADRIVAVDVCMGFHRRD